MREIYKEGRLLEGICDFPLPLSALFSFRSFALLSGNYPSPPLAEALAYSLGARGGGRGGEVPSFLLIFVLRLGSSSRMKSKGRKREG